jgi:hypothetical protein
MRKIDEHTRRVILDLIEERKDEKAFEVLLNEWGVETDSWETMTFLPLSSYGKVAAGATVNIVGRPQVPMTALRFGVTMPTGKHFVINDLRCGLQAVLPAPGSLDGEIFTTQLANLGLLTYHSKIEIDQRAIQMMGRAINAPPLMVAMDFVVTATNKTAEAWPFSGFVVGRSVQ